MSHNRPRIPLPVLASTCRIPYPGSVAMAGKACSMKQFGNGLMKVLFRTFRSYSRCGLSDATRVVGTVVYSPMREALTARPVPNVGEGTGNRSGGRCTASVVTGVARRGNRRRRLTGSVHPAARIIPPRNRTRRMVLIFIQYRLSCGAPKYSLVGGHGRNMPAGMDYAGR